MKTKFAALILSLAPLCTQAQKVWTLDECIAYALEHNTQVLQNRLQVENAELQLHTSRMSRLPDLNASLGQGFGFGRSQGRDGTTVDNTSANTSFGVYTSVPLFTAFRIPNQIKADRESLLSTQEQMEAQKRTLSINITTVYLNALYYTGLVEVARQQVATDSLMLEQTQSLVEAGRKAENEALQAQAKLAQSQLQLTTATGNLRSARLDLLQAISCDDSQLPVPAPLNGEETAAMQARLLGTDSWIVAGVEANPAVLAAQHQLKSSEFQLKATRSGYFPTLSFSAGYNTGYFHSYNYENLPFGRQLNLNGSENVSLSLSIPIFNRFNTRNNVRRAEINIQNQRLQLNETRRQLRRQVQQARIDAQNASERLRSAETAAASSSAAFEAEQEKYKNGTGTLYSLSQAHQNLVSAQNDVVQAKTELELRLLILRYYE